MGILSAPTIDHDSIALYGGRWQVVRGIQRWVPEPWSPPVRREVDIHDLIACPTCHCRADETCRTRKGLRTNDHANRLIARRCPCGANVAPRCRYCADCARANELAGKRAARERMATVTQIGADWSDDDHEFESVLELRRRRADADRDTARVVDELRGLVVDAKAAPVVAAEKPEHEPNPHAEATRQALRDRDYPPEEATA